jgi:hypothetical protein
MYSYDAASQKVTDVETFLTAESKLLTLFFDFRRQFMLASPRVDHCDRSLPRAVQNESGVVFRPLEAETTVRIRLSAASPLTSRKQYLSLFLSFFLCHSPPLRTDVSVYLWTSECDSFAAASAFTLRWRASQKKWSCPS